MPWLLAKTQKAGEQRCIQASMHIIINICFVFALTPKLMARRTLSSRLIQPVDLVRLEAQRINTEMLSMLRRRSTPPSKSRYQTTIVALLGLGISVTPIKFILTRRNIPATSSSHEKSHDCCRKRVDWYGNVLGSLGTRSTSLNVPTSLSLPWGA